MTHFTDEYAQFSPLDQIHKKRIKNNNSKNLDKIWIEDAKEMNFQSKPIA